MVAWHMAWLMFSAQLTSRAVGALRLRALRVEPACAIAFLSFFQAFFGLSVSGAKVQLNANQWTASSICGPAGRTIMHAAL